jgi:hypothetical protein
MIIMTQIHEPPNNPPLSSSAIYYTSPNNKTSLNNFIRCIPAKETPVSEKQQEQNYKEQNGTVVIEEISSSFRHSKNPL